MGERDRYGRKNLFTKHVMADVQIAIIDEQQTKITLAVPGIQGIAGPGVPAGGTQNQLLVKQSGVDYDTVWSDDIDIPGTLDVTGDATFDQDVTIEGDLTVNGDRIIVSTAKTPTSASDTGTAGEICWDNSYIYVAVGTNTWKRAALSSW